MDEVKVRGIQEWETPTKVTELSSFLCLVNYYHRFISGYSTKEAPLTNLPKKNNLWVWIEHCQKTFDQGLKTTMTEDLILALLDFTKIFEVHTDAFDFAIEGV
ncbi:hypothetical protein MTR67_042793 [Solanum verrucosum]|uniref:Reverse transcriptase/retrotransposon-derived protein RNase H-like domain-containing protein n=1 Tax=Solanum verrucosum TaxID=315347 RepID=A0AAF0UQ42_SOLVR|nr:hypothetical protein MTR67_042793 [Solanum verrucosum]